MTTQKAQNKALLEALHKYDKETHMNIIDKCRATEKREKDSAVKTLSADKSAKKSNTTEQNSEKQRDIKAFQTILIDKDKLSKFEQRSYMHKSLENAKAELFLSDDKKEHCTVYFDTTLNSFQRLSKDIAKKLIKAHMSANSAVKRIYRTSDFQRLLQSASSSYTDMIRSACRELASEKFLDMRKIESERTRAKYEYELLQK